MFKKIKEYFKNTEKLQIYQDVYALFFIIGGAASAVYLICKIAGWLR